MGHPLKNPNATHYKKLNRDVVLQKLRDLELFSESDLYVARKLPKEVEGIDLIHALLVEEQIKGWCLGNIIKYSCRDKGQDKLDDEKIQDYKKFLQWLND